MSSGTFSPSISGESFPVNMVSYVNLLGQGEEVTVLDAGETNGVVLIEWAEKIKNKLNYNIMEIKISFSEEERIAQIKNIHGWDSRINEFSE